MTTSMLKNVDHAALKANQLTIIALCLAAFTFDLPALVALVAAVMGLGALLGVPGFILLYRYVYRPLGLLKPDVLADNPEPHRFAQFIGFLFLTAASAALFLGADLIGWILVWTVIALAGLNAFAGFCAGCAVYYWLARFNVPGFTKPAPAGVVPGMKPKAG